MKQATLKTFGLLFLLIGCNFFSQEINSMRFKNIVEELGIATAQINLKFCLEKKMPDRKDSYIVILPIFQGKKQIDYEIRNLILITDKDGKIKNKFWDPLKIKSDLDAITDITIDTGLYTISDKIRAFGIKIRIDGPSRVAPYSSENISLYYPSEKTFIKILNQFPVRVYEGNWDAKCSGTFTYDNSTIILDQMKTNGFTNIKIKTVSTRIVTTQVNYDCKEVKSSKISSKILKFSHGTYQ